MKTSKTLPVDEECPLLRQQTKDIVGIKPSATAATLTVYPEGIQDRRKKEGGC